MSRIRAKHVAVYALASAVVVGLISWTAHQIAGLSRPAPSVAVGLFVLVLAALLAEHARGGR